MTICIAAICKDDKGNDVIVFATDHMISMGEMGQFEKNIEKFKEINHDTVAMLSGNPLIFNDAVINCGGDCDFETIKNNIHNNMMAIKDTIIQKEILNTFKIDYGFIAETLKGQIQNQYLNSLIDSVAKFSLQTSILLIGFTEKRAQIVEISETFVYDYFDMHYGAIGSGSVQALNTLLFQRQSKDDILLKTLYNVYKAKRNAEVSIGVGKETDVMFLTTEGTVRIEDEKLKILSDIYENELNFGKNHKSLIDVLPSTK